MRYCGNNYDIIGTKVIMSLYPNMYIWSKDMHRQCLGMGTGLYRIYLELNDVNPYQDTINSLGIVRGGAWDGSPSFCGRQNVHQ